MNIKQNTKLNIFAFITTIVLAGNSYAQSIDIPTVAVVRGTTTDIHLMYDAAGGPTNLDFTMSYNPSVVDETDVGFDVVCFPANVGLTSLTCTIDKVNDVIRGIGVNNPNPLSLPLLALTSGEFAVIHLPIRADAAEGVSPTTFTANFAADTVTDVTAFVDTWTPNVNLTYCNQILVSGVVQTSDTAVFDEACVTLSTDTAYENSVGPGPDAPIFLSSGLDIWMLPGFSVEQGVELSAAVCGQSLCSTSDAPMPEGCHSCVVEICAIDSSCCTDAYVQSCVDKVNSVCGLVCSD